MALPPVAGIACKFEPPNPNRIVPLLPQGPPAKFPFPFQRSSGAPSGTCIFIKAPLTKNPIHWLSGAQKGSTASVVPRKGTNCVELSLRSCSPAPSRQTIMVPSGEISGVDWYMEPTEGNSVPGGGTME